MTTGAPDPVGVSIVLPAFNRLPFLRSAIESVLAQTCRDWELIVADDGSDEATRAWLESLRDPRIKLLSRPHRGNPGAVRNTGISAATGRHVAFLDSDDIWVPERLECQLAALRAAPERRWSYCRTRMIDEHGRLLPEADFRPWASHEGDILEALLRRTASVATSSVVVERSLLVEAGAFDESRRFSEHYELWLKLGLHSAVSLCDRPLVHIRTHRENYTRDRLAALAAWLPFYREAEGRMPTAWLRGVCREMHGLAALELARHQVAADDWLSGLSTFCGSLPTGLPRSAWWRRLGRGLLRSRHGDT